MPRRPLTLGASRSGDAGPGLWTRRCMVLNYRCSATGITHRTRTSHPVISVAIIEDNRLVRESIASLLLQVTDVQVVAAVPALDDPALRGAVPHVVLLDAGLRDLDSLHGAGSVRKEFPTARVIVMDLLPAHEDIAEFVNAGVSGFILKDASFEEFLNTIRLVAGGAEVLPPRMTGSLFSQIAQVAVAKGRSDGLEDVRMTRREREVIELIGEGLSNKEIAQRLNIATHTVKSHVRNVMEKLALHTRLQIAAFSHKEGLA
jgi:DNA-binding NarL/FixJ family response regulator